MADAPVLIVDDDVELCALLKEYLGGHGYQVSAVHDGASGLRDALAQRYDLVILDVMLPVLDGFEVLRQLRRRSNVPVIMLTARAGETDRVQGFHDGVDDYLVKPFAAAELLGRIRAVLRRSTGAPLAPPRLTTAGALTLDGEAQEAFLNERPLGLTPIEFTILGVLTRAAGRVVSRDELTAALHQREATPFERSLDVHVSHLRRKLAAVGDGAGTARLDDPATSIIRTVRGVGYLCSLGS
jgi:two-component system, OmpR family, response regulator CpxR